MNANATGKKSLDKMGADPRVSEIYRDGDGYWAALADGYCKDCCTGIHGDTVKDLINQFMHVEKCPADSSSHAGHEPLWSALQGRSCAQADCKARPERIDYGSDLAWCEAHDPELTWERENQ